MKAIVSGGGTGGHIYPALSIAARLREDGAEILYMGKRDSLEARLSSTNGFAFFGVDCAGLHRRSPAIIKDLLTNVKGIRQARKKLEAYRPDVVVGTGGYAEVPVLKAAQMLGIPTVLHEQNAFPGLANRALAKKAAAVCLTFPAAAPHFPHPDRLHETGLPIRSEILQADRESARAFFQLPADDKPVLLITGGSQGADTLNRAAESAMSGLLDQGLRVLLICGKGDYPRLRQTLPDRPELLLYPYLDHMEQALALADLAVARAGASFIAEALSRGLPTLLVPYPYAANDHQRFNARSLAEQGAARVLEDSECSGPALLEQVDRLLADKDALAEMGRRAKAMAITDAADRIAAVIYQVLRKQGE